MHSPWASGQNAFQTIIGSLPEMAFPDSHNTIALCSQLSCRLQVSFFVSRDLGPPISSVCFGNVPTSQASVPEAAVDKHRKSLVLEDEIWLSWKIRVSSPPGYFVFAQDFEKSTFCRCITL